MAYKKGERDRALVAFTEGAFFGFVTALFVATLAKPALKITVVGFFGYILFIVVRGLLDYNRSENR